MWVPCIKLAIGQFFSGHWGFSYRVSYRIAWCSCPHVTGVAVELPQAETVVRGWSEPSYKLAIKADRLWHVATALLHYISSYVCVCACVCSCRAVCVCRHGAQDHAQSRRAAFRQRRIRLHQHRPVQHVRISCFRQLFCLFPVISFTRPSHQVCSDNRILRDSVKSFIRLTRKTILITLTAPEVSPDEGFRREAETSIKLMLLWLF